MQSSRFSLLLPMLALGFALLFTGAPPAFAAQDAAAPRRDAVQLAEAVERRSEATSFEQLEAFGLAAMRTPGREGLNRLYHVTWTTMNQGDFEQAALWNGRLATAAARQGDRRYARIAHLNALAIRYDTGEDAAADEMAAIAATETDWFVKAHATRLHAIALMDQDQIGEGLKRLSDVLSQVPVDAPFSDTARAGLWEVTGVGLMKLNDMRGATDAFGRFELDFSRPDYPRPDFDAVYNLTRLAIQVGDQAMAERLFVVHHRLTVRSNIESLSVYDANLCAAVASARGQSRAVLDCMAALWREPRRRGLPSGPHAAGARRGPRPHRRPRRSPS